MPVQVNGRPASSTNPLTWGSFDAVKARSERVGFVLGCQVGGKHLVCVDLDHALTQDGGLTVGAAKVLDLFPATWVEVSPSGDGLHVWGVTDYVPGRCVFTFEGQSVEVYTSGRYLTVTGRPFEGSPLLLADVSEGLRMIV